MSLTVGTAGPGLLVAVLVVAGAAAILTGVPNGNDAVPPTDNLLKATVDLVLVMVQDMVAPATTLAAGMVTTRVAALNVPKLAGFPVTPLFESVQLKPVMA